MDDESKMTSKEAGQTPSDVEAGHRPSTSHDASTPPNLVDWDGEHDPQNPLEWSFAKKVWISAMVALMSFCVSFSSSIFSAAIEVTAKEFNVREEVTILGVSLYVLGFAFGPLAWGPISELYGRSQPLLIGFFVFAIFNIPVATASNIQTILVCRFIGAAFGVAVVAIAPGVIVDVWAPFARGIASIAWALTILGGPAFGPVVGDFVVKNPNLGWRWTAWITLIISAVVFVLSLPTAPETFAPVLLQRKAARLRFETKSWALHSRRDEEPVEYGALARKYGLKPFQMLAREPILLTMTIFMSLVYAIMYLTFFAFPYSFADVRGWDIGVSSLPFLGLFVGYFLGAILILMDGALRYKRLLTKHGKKIAPEERLPPIIVASFILAGGLFWFAWTANPHISWVPQVVSSVAIGCGSMGAFMPSMVYLMDIYLQNAASALAGNAFMRAVLAFAFPLFANPMYKKLGVQWATSLLAFLCLALAPFPMLFYLYGKRIRGWSKYVVDRS